MHVCIPSNIMPIQDRSHHIWGGQVHKHATARGVWGHAPPENFWNLKAKRLPLRPFLVQCDVPWRPDYSLISQATPFADEPGLRDYNPSLGRTERCWKSFIPLFVAVSQVSACHLCACGPCMGVRRVMALIGDTKQARVWQRETKQATGEGKSGPVETRLTGPAATALLYYWY